MAKKVAKKAKAGRGSDQFMIRMPAGMRDVLKAEAEINGRSMNAEIIARLMLTLTQTISAEGLQALSKRLEATTYALEDLFYDVRDLDIDGFIADERQKGNNFVTRGGAIRQILREFLSAKGYLRTSDEESKGKL